MSVFPPQGSQKGNKSKRLELQCIKGFRVGSGFQVKPMHALPQSQQLGADVHFPPCLHLVLRVPLRLKLAREAEKFGLATLAEAQGLASLRGPAGDLFHFPKCTIFSREIPYCPKAPDGPGPPKAILKVWAAYFWALGVR
jgi:hypothetical protein